MLSTWYYWIFLTSYFSKSVLHPISFSSSIILRFLKYFISLKWKLHSENLLFLIVYLPIFTQLNLSWCHKFSDFLCNVAENIINFIKMYFCQPQLSFHHHHQCGRAKTLALAESLPKCAKSWCTHKSMHTKMSTVGCTHFSELDLSLAQFSPSLFSPISVHR